MRSLICAAAFFAVAGLEPARAQNRVGEWTHYGGNAASQKYSPLDQINKDNIGKLFVQVMWRYLEQASFPMTPQEYQEHLEAVATYLQGWGAFAQVMEVIQSTRERPRLGKAISIPIELGERASEWMVGEF